MIKYWNTHHNEEHPTYILKCNICNKLFHTPSAKRAHQNYHASHKHHCSQCWKTFTFVSALRQHAFVHATSMKHKCFAGGCSHSYKWLQDLNRHIKTHTHKAESIVVISVKKHFSSNGYSGDMLVNIVTHLNLCTPNVAKK